MKNKYPNFEFSTVTDDQKILVQDIQTSNRRLLKRVIKATYNNPHIAKGTEYLKKASMQLNAAVLFHPRNDIDD